MPYPNDNLMDKLDDVIADASTASSAVGTIASGSDVVVSNFAGLQDLVDSLSAFASLMKSGVFYAPVGLIAPFGGLSGNVPDGWFLCDGSPKSTSTYADLYAVLGANAYATDSGGNFYLPDLRGRTVFGLNSANAATNARTDNDGVAEASRAPSHTHTSNDHSHDSGSFYTRIVPSSQSVWYGQYSSNGETWVNNWNGGGMSLVNNSIGNTFGGGLDVSGNSGGSSDRGMTTATVPYGIANYIIKW